MMRISGEFFKVCAACCLVASACVPITVSNGGPGEYDSFQAVEVEVNSAIGLYEEGVDEIELAEIFSAELRAGGNFEEVGLDVPGHDLRVEVEVFVDTFVVGIGLGDCDTYEASVSYVSRDVEGAYVGQEEVTIVLYPEYEGDEDEEYDLLDFFTDLADALDEHHCPTKDAAARIALRDLAEDFVYIAPYRF